MRRALLVVAMVGAGLVAAAVPAGAGAPKCGGLDVTINGADLPAGQINGTEGDDVILGRAGGDVILGNGGNDVICGGRGNDFIYSGDGRDRIIGGKGLDQGVGGNGSRDRCNVEVVFSCERITGGLTPLKGDGIDRFDFGDAGAPRVLKAFRNAFGPSDSDLVNDECGAGPLRLVTWNDVLQVIIDPDTQKFVGYFIQETSPLLITRTGATVTMTLADFSAGYGDGVVETSTGSLGAEFVVGDYGTSDGVGGFLTSEAPEGVVTGIYAGTTCFFR